VRKELLKGSDFLIAAITQRNIKWEHGADRDALENDYVEYLEKNSIKLVPVPNVLEKPAEFFIRCPEIEALILSGGGNSEKRGKTEKALLEEAVKRGLPVLGICHGMQALNLFFGGKLEKVKNHVRVDHEIKFTGRIVESLGIEQMEVNSYHNLAVLKEGLSPELKVFAETSDGIIEGLFHPKLPIAGIEWHPERMDHENQHNKKIIELFREGKLYWEKGK